MSILNKDKIKARVEETKGKTKEVAGKVVGDEKLEQKGKIQNTGGKVQAGYGDLKGLEAIEKWVRRYLAAKSKRYMVI